jgi:uncharacterized protein
MIQRYRPSTSASKARVPRLYVAVLLALVSVTVTSCSRSTGQPNPSEPAVVATCASATPELPRPTEVVIGAGNPGGVFYPYANGLAGLLDGHLDGSRVRTVVTGGSVENLRLLGEGEIDIGLTTADATIVAVAGTDGFQNPIAACGLAVLYTSFIHVVARDDANIRTMSDLKGKRISFGPNGSSTELIAPRLLGAVGLQMTDVTSLRMTAAESIAGLQSGALDGFFWLAGTPGAAFVDLFNETAVHFVDTEQAAAKVMSDYPGIYQTVRLEPNTYPHQTKIVKGLGVANLLVARASLPAATVRKSLTSMFANMDALHAIHPVAAGLQRATATANMPIPLHRGAISFYDS